MHAFMAAGLLRRPRFYSFNADSQAQPPDRELAQVKQGMGGSEGHAVGAADVGRQAALLKKPLKHSESIVFTGRRKSLTGEEKTAGMGGDRQRIAGSKITSLCLAGLGIRRFDPIAQAAELSDHSRSASLSRLFVDGGASFFVKEPLVQDQPDEPALSMGDGPDSLVMS